MNPRLLHPPTLETTHGQIDGFFGQLPFKCHPPEVTFVADGLKVCPWVASRVAPSVCFRAKREQRKRVCVAVCFRNNPLVLKGHSRGVAPPLINSGGACLGGCREAFMVYGLEFMVYGLWFIVYGVWFKVSGSWFMVYGL